MLQCAREVDSAATTASPTRSRPTAACRARARDVVGRVRQRGVEAGIGNVGDNALRPSPKTVRRPDLMSRPQPRRRRWHARAACTVSIANATASLWRVLGVDVDKARLRERRQLDGHDDRPDGRRSFDSAGHHHDRRTCSVGSRGSGWRRPTTQQRSSTKERESAWRNGKRGWAMTLCVCRAPSAADAADQARLEGRRAPP